MRSTTRTKGKLIHLSILAPEKHFEKPLYLECGNYPQAIFPILTIVAIPWTTWKTNHSLPLLQQSIIGRYKMDIKIPVSIKQKENTTSYEQIINTLEDKDTTPKVEKKEISITCDLDETLLIETKRNKILPPQNRRSLPRITGTWPEFIEYFEGNWEGGWRNLIQRQGNQNPSEKNYVPPLCLHIDLSLIKDKKPDFEACGLPIGDDLGNLIRATGTPKNRFATIILHGKKEIVDSYQKEIQSVLTKNIPDRYNLRVITPVEVSLEAGLLNTESNDEKTNELSQKVWESLPKWQEALKETSKSPEKEIQLQHRKLFHNFLNDALEGAAKRLNIQSQIELVHDYRLSSLPTIEELIKEKTEWEEKEKTKKNYEEERGWKDYNSREFPKEKFLTLVRDIPEGLETWLKAFQVNDNKIDKILEKLETHKFTGAKNLLNNYYEFQILWPEKAAKETHYKSIWSSETEASIKKVGKDFKTWGASFNSTTQLQEILDILELDEPLDFQPQTDFGKTALAAFKSLQKQTKDILEQKAKTTIQEVKNCIKTASTKIQVEPTTIQVNYIYGEISQRPPKPASQETLKIEVPKNKPIQKEDWEKISEQLGKNHTEILTYVQTEGNRKWAKLLLPSYPEEYVEPSTLPSIPKELKELSILDRLEEKNKEKGKENPHQIRLTAQLKAITDPITELFLDIDQRQIEIFNPVIGKPTGFKETLLWRPVLTKQGIEWANSALQEFGYELNVSPAVHNYVEKKVRKGERVLSPNYALTQYEMLAYYRNEERTAQQTIYNPDTGNPLWIEGKSYQITPSWDREQILVDNFSEEEEEATPTTDGPSPDLTILGSASSKIAGAERIERLSQVSINFGFSTFLIQGEDHHVHKIKETINRDNAGLEKERIAEEIQMAKDRVDEIKKSYKTSNQIHYPTNKAKDELPLITPAVQREQRDLTDKIQGLEIELNSWSPSIDDFLEAFPPESPPLATQVYEEQLRHSSRKIIQRFGPFLRSDLNTQNTKAEEAPHCTIKNYQLRGAALMALKRNSGCGSPPGAGKTLTALMASWEMGHHYNLVIAPTIALNTWASELEKVGLHHEVIGYRKGKDDIWRPSGTSYQDIRKITLRMHQRVRTPNRLGKIEAEYYVISAETLSLGGEGNLQFDPWHFDYPLNKKTQEALKKNDIPSHWSIINAPIKNWKKINYDEPYSETIEGQEVWFGKHLRVWSDRIDNNYEIEKNGMKGILKTISFRRAIKTCPTCSAEGEDWSDKGHCKTCGHIHSSTSKKPTGWSELQSRLTFEQLQQRGVPITGSPLSGSKWEGKKTSNLQFPGYKLIRKHFGLKIIDEIHNFSSFTSQHGNALLQIKTKDTMVLSGTLCRTHIAELEPTLCHIYEPNSGEFPYSPWGMELFQEQFSTYEIRSETEFRRLGTDRRAKRKKVTSRIPEASNLTKLRSLMHGVLVSVSEREMAKEWNLKPITERIRYVDLQEENAEIYEEWKRKIQEAYKACETQGQKSAMLQEGRRMLTSLGYACDGPEKLQAAVEWVREGIAQGKRNVIVGPSTRFYTLLNQELKTQGIPFMTLGSMGSEKRFEVLNKFRESGCPVLTSRIRLINVNFNQLTCCQRILFTGIDPSPAAIRQMQMRLNRIGQTETVECEFLITRGRPARVYGRINPKNLRDIEAETEQATSNIETQGNPESTKTYEENLQNRPPSYEERLFATVLRREKAIQAVLNQADKQRDPQELYDMLQDRQTLNQVLQDIATEATLDLSILKPFEGNPIQEIQQEKEVINITPTVQMEKLEIPNQETPKIQKEIYQKPQKPKQLSFGF